MSEESKEQREYKAMLALDDVIGELREHGWTREQLVDRVESIVDDAEDDV